MWNSSHLRYAAGATALVITAAVGPAVGLVSTPAAAAAPSTQGLLLHYDMRQATSTGVPDSSGNGRNGVLSGGAALDASSGGVVLDGTDDYVDLPDNLMQGLDAITVSIDLRVDPQNSGGSWPWGLGNTAGNGQGNGYLFTTAGNYRTSISLGNYTAEQTVEKRAAARTGTSTTLTYTLGADDVAVLYEDGTEIARRPGTDIAPSAIGGGTTTENFIGRSLYRGDPYFKGVVSDFRIYNRALSAAEVADLASAGDAQRVAADRDRLTLGDTTAVEEDLTLPQTGRDGSTITWATSDAAVITAAGKITRPAAGSAPRTATLTATVRRGIEQATKTFTVTVAPQRAAADRLADAAAALAQLPALTTGPVRGSLTLPGSGAEVARSVTVPSDARDVAITWTSSQPSVITDTDSGSGDNVISKGFLTRPAAATQLTLTATLSAGGQTRQVAFPVSVPAAAPLAATDMEAYAFAYFTGDSIPGEKIRLAVSKGNDALQWQTLNNGAPILESTKGDQGLRDPFVMRSHEGDRFFMLATDLSAARNGFPTAKGSKYLEIWESTDLVNWGEQRHIKVSADNFGMTWAPEAYWDETIGAYVVYWTSSTYTDATRTTPQGNNPKIYYATTRDFRTFTDPQLWLSAEDVPGTRAASGMIDTTMIKEGGTYHRFTKVTDASGCASADIVQQKSTTLRAPGSSGAWSVVSRCIGRNAGTPEVEGPSVFKANPGDVNGGNRTYLWVDNFGGIGYIPLYTTSLDNPTWIQPQRTTYSLPPSPRHGGVMNITAAERTRLVTATDPQTEVTATKQVQAYAAAGAAQAALPATVQATFADGHVETVPVTWGTQALDGLAPGNTLVVTGKLPGGATVPATARITRLPSALVPTIVGTPAVGSPVTASIGAGWTGATYAWLRDGQATGATGSTYTPSALDAGRVLSVTVGALDPAGTSSRATSAGVQVAAGSTPPTTPPTTTPPVVTPAASVTTTVLRHRAKVRATRKGVRVRVVVVSSGGPAPGAVRITERGKLLGSATLVGGTAKVRLPRSLRKGRHVLTATYLPSLGFAASAGTSTITIKAPARKAARR